MKLLLLVSSCLGTSTENDLPRFPEPCYPHKRLSHSQQDMNREENTEAKEKHETKPREPGGGIAERSLSSVGDWTDSELRYNK